MVKDTVLELISEISVNPIDFKITEETHFSDDLNFYSLEVFTLITEIEEKYNISFTEKETRNMESVGELIALSAAKLEE